MPETPPVVLTIAGFDPSSGAGVTADIKTIAAHDCYGVACITALTVQSTRGVRRVFPAAPEVVRETLEELAADFELAAVHIGMLGSGILVQAVADFLAAGKLANVVLDPVLKASSGAALLDGPGIRLLAEKLFPLATVITPNMDEAAAFTGLEVSNLEQMRAAVLRLQGMGATAVVVTGGHLDPAVDLLSIGIAAGDVEEDVEEKVFQSERLQSNSTHGTGCAFSTALACNLSNGRGLEAAVSLAKNYVAEAIQKAYPLGRGTGPVNHLFNRRNRTVRSDPENAV
jgi:hydroxymethylpyrimidine/phosphomethylpyrimidine kinase